MEKNPPASAGDAGDSGDAGTILGLGRSPGGRNGNPHQYSCLDNSMDTGVWWAVCLCLWDHKESGTTEHMCIYIASLPLYSVVQNSHRSL